MSLLFFSWINLSMLNLLQVKCNWMALLSLFYLTEDFSFRVHWWNSFTNDSRNIAIAVQSTMYTFRWIFFHDHLCIHHMGMVGYFCSVVFLLVILLLEFLALLHLLLHPVVFNNSSCEKPDVSACFLFPHASSPDTWAAKRGELIVLLISFFFFIEEKVRGQVFCK